MAKVGAQRAAELTGKSKSTIQRSMNNGKLSYEVDSNNRRIVDVSELERVFGLEPQGNASISPATYSHQNSLEAELKKAAEMLEVERMKMKIRALEGQLDTAETTIEDLKSQRDQWQKQAQQVLITSQYSQRQAEELKAELKDREEKSRKRREEMMKERMKRLQGQGQNQNQPQDDAQEQQETASSFDFSSLWKKLKGDKAA